MTRKEFIADIAAAAAQVIPRITNVAKGDDDGDVNFRFDLPTGSPLDVGLVALDVYKYPSTSFLVFSRSEEPGKVVADVLADVTNAVTNMRITDAIILIAKRLSKSLAVGSNEDPVVVDEDGADLSDNSQSEYEYPDPDDEEDDFNTHSSRRSRLNQQDAMKLKHRIARDLRLVHDAKFKLGVLKGMTPDADNGMLSVSLRVRRLGLSEEAMQAWDLEPQQYIVLLLRFTNGYKTLEDIIDEPAKNSGVTFRVGVSSRCKPTLKEALSAFSEHESCESEVNDGDQPTLLSRSNDSASFSTIFISSSLNQFLQDHFITLLKIRKSRDLSWEGAKNCLSQMQGRIFDNMSSDLDKSTYERPLKDKLLPTMLLADHFSDKEVQGHSFPLVAAQFTFHYLVRCTEFCLVCHDNLDDKFEALKPYVCSKPLCLYQYMSLGFGPSLEHELRTQPYVADLLVSFCYVSALRFRMREYPVGMSLLVPPVTPTFPEATSNPQPGEPLVMKATAVPSSGASYHVKYDSDQHEATIQDLVNVPLRKGDWVVITASGQSTSTHHRVNEVSSTTIFLSKPIDLDSRSQPNDAPTGPATPAVTPPLVLPSFTLMTIYNQNFDELSDRDKSKTVVTLLQTLPSSKELVDYVVNQGRLRVPRLVEWSERISPAALGLLRWIIASNRSCLVQVDQFFGEDSLTTARTRVRAGQKISNIGDDWIQFRFAQGAPDKEQRFLTALCNEKNQLNGKYPTLFAFHGSPVDNWHSIIRHGLDFKETINGRAFGNGVYHASEQETSNCYAKPETNFWPGSQLKITSVMSVNEIVNCPAKFTSHAPFLVVQHIDWIQCRYLLCKVGGNAAGVVRLHSSSALKLREDVDQDPKYSARCRNRKPIGIPQCAVAISRSFWTKPNEAPKSKKKRLSEPHVDDTDLSSDVDVEDLAFMLSDDGDTSCRNSVSRGKGKGPELPFSPTKKQKISQPYIDFLPGALDQSTLPRLSPPVYATSTATKRLQQELKAILHIQESTPLDELGWYVNPDLISNVYQWIVELHSFDAALPLARDMKAASITSIVLEIRFGKAYPHSPPFIRVIRPRFLPFMRGGGGHVTGGGAMCMELLTNSGWSVVSTLESVLLQVRIALMNLEPKPARLENKSISGQRDYGTAEAMEAYIRACRAHGWEVPKDFQEFAPGSAEGGALMQ